MVLYHAGDMAGAIMQQHKELIINERCLGSDHPDTAHSYMNMALFYHGLNQTELALRHMARTLVLLNVSCGSYHPDVAATFTNIAMMYQDVGKMNVALRYLQEALQRNETLLGTEHIQTAVCYHALAIAFNCMGAYKLSLQHERSTYNILLKQLGEEDSRTKDSAKWIKTFQIRADQASAQKQKGQQAVSAATAQKAAADLLKANPSLAQAFQQASASSSVNRGPIGRSPELQRVRGAPDERAARAANEVRKKAAARGLNVRPQATAPNQSIPPLGDLLSLINSGVAGKALLASNTPSSSIPRGTAKAPQRSERKATAAARPGPVSAVSNRPAAADLSSP
jgi:protein TIF31